MLLFSKKQTLEQAEAKKIKDKGGKQLDELLAEPIDPDENEEVNVEDLVYDVLHLSERNLELLTEKSMAIAIDNFVSHNETGAIEATVESTLAKNQKDLMARGRKGKSMDKNSIRELTIQKSNEQREKDKLNDDAVKRKLRNSELRASVPLWRRSTHTRSGMTLY